MLIQDGSKARPSDELVAQVGGDAALAQHLVDRKDACELPDLRAAQDFQEEVVAKQNERGLRGEEGLGQCVARMDIGLFRRITAKHAAEIAADQRKFWLVTAPKLYPQLGLKPRYVAKTGISHMGLPKLRRLGG
jgi:hypothetical protein